MAGCASPARDDVLGGTPDVVAEVSTADDVPVVQDAPTVDDTPEVEDTPAVEDTPEVEVLEGVQVAPSDAAQLRQWVLDAEPGTTFLLADGTYDLSGGDSGFRIIVLTDGITIRGASGDRDAVVLDGGWGINEIIFIEASDVTIADLTVKKAIHHPIHITGGKDGDTSGVVIDNVAVIDPGQQAIKINATGSGHHTDQGVVQGCHIEMTDEGRQHTSGCYTGGIDAHRAWGWTIRDNTIHGFWCATGLSEHGVHFWTGSRDTVVERNIITDCARGIGFGLGKSDDGRVYDDSPCDGASAPMGHWGGVIRNNAISANRAELLSSQAGFDTGIALAQACDVKVLHNSVWSATPPFTSIEWRFAKTSATITNNAVSYQLVPRDGAQATVEANLEQQPASLWASPAEHDLHLAPGAAAAIDQGAALPAGDADDDFDGDPRPADARDIGCDERAE